MSYSTDDQTEATETTGLPLEDRLEEAMTLLDIGLQKLIGVKKSIPGVKVTKSNNDLPSLIGIAPAVWNIPYLQVRLLHRNRYPSDSN